MNAKDAKRMIINKLYEETAYNCIDVTKIYEHIWQNITLTAKNFHWLVKSSQIQFFFCHSIETFLHTGEASEESSKLLTLLIKIRSISLSMSYQSKLLKCI